MQNTPNLKERIIILFIFIDDLLKSAPDQASLGRKVGRKSGLCESEILSLAMLQHLGDFRTKKALWEFLNAFCHELFPGLPAYQNFVSLTNSRSIEAAKLLLLICSFNRENAEGVKAIDSSPLPVCGNKRIFSHKVAKGVAARGKSSIGWFYGFKIHLTCDLKGNLLSIALTAGNTDDRKVTEGLLKDIKGLVLADAGYVSKKLQQKLIKSGTFLFAAVRANMKKLMTKGQHKLMKKRQMVETVIGVLKERLGLVSSLSRSVLGHFARYIYSCLAYCFKQQAKADSHLLLIS